MSTAVPIRRSARLPRAPRVLAASLFGLVWWAAFSGAALAATVNVETSRAAAAVPTAAA